MKLTKKKTRSKSETRRKTKETQFEQKGFNRRVEIQVLKR